MKLVYHKRFLKRISLLSAKDRIKVEETLILFEKNPFDQRLKNHELKGDMVGKRSISVRSDLRIIFEEFDGYVVVLLLNVGTHNQVY